MSFSLLERPTHSTTGYSLSLTLTTVPPSHPSLHSARAASNASGWHRLQSSGSQPRLHLGFSQKFILILGLRANPRSMKSAPPNSGQGDRRHPGDCYMQPRLTTAAPEGQSHPNLVPVWGHKPILLQWLRWQRLPAVQETRGRSLGEEDPLEKGMATHSILLPGEFHG